MLENARRQLFLVLLSIVAGIVCVILFPLPLGHDLKGGTQIRYEVPPDVIAKLREKEMNISVDKIMDDTIGVIRERIDPTGATDPTITRSGDYGILIELPWYKDRTELKRLLERVGNLGKLEFRIVADKDFIEGPVQFDMQREKSRLEAWLKQDGIKKLLLEDPRNIRRFNEDQAQGPVQFRQPRVVCAQAGPGPEAQRELGPLVDDLPCAEPGDGQALRGCGVEQRSDPRGLHEEGPCGPLSARVRRAQHEGEVLHGRGPRPGRHQRGAEPGRWPRRALQPSGRSRGRVRRVVEKYIGKASAIVLNDFVRSAPTFVSKIPGGHGQITGGFTKEEVEDLVKVLRTGSLRVEPEKVSQEDIGPTLGTRAIVKGASSLLAGSLFVFAFMLWYYRKAGTIACITLVLNVFLLWASMLFMQATITLPGLGGIVLTMGMAVDANVLIYERIREELAKGKDMLRAVRAGFERAMSAILDSNITTFLVGLVLFNVGVGPVRGFAVTLMVGIVTTVFTQFFVTRLLFHYALEKNYLVDYRPRTMFTNINLDYVRLIGKCVAGSTIIITVGLVYAFFVVPREVLLGTDFTGGANLKMVLAEPTSADDVKGKLSNDAAYGKEYPNVAVNYVGDIDAQGKATKFNVRLKLRDVQRDQIEQGRKAWREARITAEKAGQAPPAAYEPPYVAELRRIFSEQLVKPAFNNAMTEKHETQANLRYAQIDLHFQQPVPVEKAREALTKGLQRALVTPIGSGTAPEASDLHVEWTTQASTKDWELFDIVKLQLAELKDPKGEPIVLSEPFPEASEIQGRLVDDLRNAAIGSLVLAWALIVLYLRVRFHEYKYGIAAVVALIHDVLVAFVAVAFFNHIGLVHAEIDLSMIACFLTIIGYSVNDTIVIFDRIRENVTENAKLGTTEGMRTLINRALNQTMSRTLLTSGLTMLVVLAQFFVNWGSESDLESFAFAMFIGMVSGVYSTIYIAAPILIWLDKRKPADKAKVTAVPAATPQAT
jgi:SecD/SecF fusion protein